LHFKTAVSGSSRRSAGREFHTDGPTTEKARSANLVLVLWATYLALLDDRRPWHWLTVLVVRPSSLNDEGVSF